MGRHRLVKGIVLLFLVILIFSLFSFLTLLPREDNLFDITSNSKNYKVDIKLTLPEEKTENWETRLNSLVDKYKRNQLPEVLINRVSDDEAIIALSFKKEKQHAKKSMSNTDVKTAEPTEQFTVKKPSVSHIDYRKEKMSIPTPGVLNVHIWEAWCGSRIEDLKRNKGFPLYPSFKTSLTRFFAQWFETGYGERIFGYIHPPETGNYTFAVSCDDNCEVWLSNTSNPRFIRKIASVGTFENPTNTKVADFRQEKSQISVEIYLEENRKYYIEALHKQAAYKDHILLTWLAPGWPRIRTISQDYISSFVTTSEEISDIIDYSKYIPITKACQQSKDIYDESSVYYFNNTKYKFGTIDSRSLLHNEMQTHDFEDLLPTVSYAPSYVLDFMPKRYEGVKLIHESSVYPDDYTELTHMLKYERCDIHRMYDSHMNPLNPEKKITGALFSNSDWFQSQNYKLSTNDIYPDSKNDSYKGLHSEQDSYDALDQPAAINKEIFTDKKDFYKKPVNENDIDDEEFLDDKPYLRKVSDNNEKNEKSIGQKTNFLSKSFNNNLKSKLLKRVENLEKDDNYPKAIYRNRKLLELNSEKSILPQLKPGSYVSLLKSKMDESDNDDDMSNMKTKNLMANVISYKKIENVTHAEKGENGKQTILKKSAIFEDGLPKDVKENNQRDKPIKVPSKLNARLQELEDKLIARTNKQGIKISESTRNNSAKSFIPSSNPKKSFSEELHSPFQQYQYHIPPPVKRKIFFRNGVADQKEIDLANNRYMIWMYDIFGPAIYYLSRKPVRQRAWVYNSLLSDCKSDGNPRLSEQVAKNVVNKFMTALKRRYKNKYRLQRIVNIEENHDVINGNRYLLELQLLSNTGKSVVVSKYVYEKLGSNSLSYPADFQWDPLTTVHVIVPVKDQGHWVQHFINNMGKIFVQTNDLNLNVIIVDFESSDINIEKSLMQSKLKRYELVKLTGPFQRALGLQAGVELVKNEKDIIFMCDLHLEIPGELITSIRKHTIYHKMAFAPMVHRLSCGYTPELPYGLWEIQGYGLMSITKHDFDRVGGMNTKEFKTKWGGEDWEFLDRTLAHGLEVERMRIPHFFHYYHSKKRMWVVPKNNTTPLDKLAVGF